MGSKDAPELSAEILETTARAPMMPYQDVRMVPVGNDRFQRVEERYPRGAPGRERDVFDMMLDQQARRNAELQKKNPDHKATIWLTPTMVQAGREYRDLFELLQSAGIKCSADLSTVRAGTGGSFMDVYAERRRRYRLFVAAITDAEALRARRKGKPRVVTSEDLARVDRRLITLQAVVDQVCIAGKPVSQVLQEHGWATGGKNQMTLNRALAGALERMQGI